MPKLIVTAKDLAKASGRRNPLAIDELDILVDGESVGVLNESTAYEMEIEPGEHVLTAFLEKMEVVASGPFNFSIAENEVKQLLVVPNYNRYYRAVAAFIGFFILFANIPGKGYDILKYSALFIFMVLQYWFFIYKGRGMLMVKEMDK